MRRAYRNYNEDINYNKTTTTTARENNNSSRQRHKLTTEQIACQPTLIFIANTHMRRRASSWKKLHSTAQPGHGACGMAHGRDDLLPERVVGGAPNKLQAIAEP